MVICTDNCTYRSWYSNWFKLYRNGWLCFTEKGLPIQKRYFLLRIFHQPVPGRACSLLSADGTDISFERQLSCSIITTADVTMADYPDEELC